MSCCPAADSANCNLVNAIKHGCKESVINSFSDSLNVLAVISVGIIIFQVSKALKLKFIEKEKKSFCVFSSSSSALSLDAACIRCSVNKISESPKGFSTDATASWIKIMRINFKTMKKMCPIHYTIIKSVCKWQKNNDFFIAEQIEMIFDDQINRSQQSVRNYIKCRLLMLQTLSKLQFRTFKSHLVNFIFCIMNHENANKIQY